MPDQRSPRRSAGMYHHAERSSIANREFSLSRSRMLCPPPVARAGNPHSAPPDAGLELIAPGALDQAVESGPE